MEEIILPTIQACKEFGICRTNEDIIAKSKPDTYGFITGPQTKMLFSSENFDFENKFYDTFNYKPKFNNQNDPIHSNLNKNVIDEVVLEFIKNRPTRITREDPVDGQLVRATYDEQTTDDEVYYAIRIAPKDVDWLSFSHENEWGRPGGLIQTIITAIGGGLQSVESFMSIYNNVTNDDTRSRKIVKTEFTSEWQDTKKISFDIPFVLFTAGGSLEAFVRDIYQPIMTLTRLIYPTRMTREDVEEMVREQQERERIEKEQNEDLLSTAASEYHYLTEEEIQEKHSQPSSSDPNSKTKSPEELIDEVVRYINSLSAGTRMAYLEPPNHVRVTHSSGLFRFAKCGITNFSYNYKGPWVKTGQSGGFHMDENYSSVFGMKDFMDRGFPCIAECTLSLTTLDTLYSDDWAEMYENSDITKLSGERNQDVEIEDPINDPPRSESSRDTTEGIGSEEDKYNDKFDAMDSREIDEYLRRNSLRGDMGQTTRPPSFR